MTSGTTKKIELLLEAVAAIAAIVALIPAFGQWQDPRIPASNSAASVGNVRPTLTLAATTSPQTESPQTEPKTVVIVTSATPFATPTQPESTQVVPAGGYYNVRPRHSNKCLGIVSSSHDNGAAVIQWDCDGSDNQLWSFVAAGGYYNVKPKHSNKCLGIVSSSRDNGAAVIQWDCDGSDNQLWQLVSIQ